MEVQSLIHSLLIMCHIN